jgi:universal stress protein A
MKLFRRILCPIDFSEDSVKALQWSQHLTKKHGSELTILHVMESYPAAVDVGIDYEKYHAAIVRDMQAFLAPLEVPYHTMQSSGLPSDKITALAGTLGASLILMGTRGLRGTAHRLIGSTTESVVRHSPVPVMTLSPVCSSFHEIDSSRILLPVSKLDWPIPGFIRLRQIIRNLNGSLTMLNVVDIKDALFDSSFNANPTLVTTYEVEARTQALQKMSHQLIKGSEAPETILKFGEASQEILREAGMSKYGCILMGAKRHKVFSRFFGSTAYNVISQAPVPVITIRVESR